MTPLLKKLGIIGGQRIWMINTPPFLLDLINELDKIEWSDGRMEADYIHIFVMEQSELFGYLPMMTASLAPKGMLWVSWPKKAAKMPGDLDRETVREILLENTTLVDVKVCSVDDTWSGLKFLHRKKKAK